MYSKLIFLFFLTSCYANEKPQDERKITNPNGMSEMSLIMEDWYKYMKFAGDDLKQGRKAMRIHSIEDKNIFTAKTSKKNIHGKEFDAFVHGFYYNYSQISKASSFNEQVEEFNLTVNSCINCHQQFCHGPLGRIKKLIVK